MNFSKRSYQSELLDRDDIPFEDIKQNMQELDFINTKLGGHKITLQAARIMIRKITNGCKGNSEIISILEIGCGGGDNLRVIKNDCEKKKIKVQLAGVDINPHCIEFARSRKENDGIRFFTSDYKLLKVEEKPDVVFSSLFCHHFNDEEVVEIMKWMKANSRVGFFINDLHRHPFAYYSIKWLTKFFSKSYLVKNDAPLSVRRGFRRRELEMLFKATLADNLQSSNCNFKIQWKWAFRWLLIVQHETK
jgi:ubiquinone/menaquinone biosynthesis C-methylase UbiE